MVSMAPANMMATVSALSRAAVTTSRTPQPRLGPWAIPLSPSFSLFMLTLP